MKLAYLNALVVAGVLTTTKATAEGSYTIDWFSIAGGGGTSQGAEFSVSGTIGQVDAGAELVGSPYTLQGGFWAVPEPGDPDTHDQ